MTIFLEIFVGLDSAI